MNEENKLSRKELEDLVIETDSGARKPDNIIAASILLVAAFTWSLFQIYIASPLPFLIQSWIKDIFASIASIAPETLSFLTGLDLSFLNLDGTKTRSVHLAFAMFLAFIAYPAFHKSPRKKIPLIDWVFALVGAFCASYILLFYDELSSRPGIIHSYLLDRKSVV